MKTRKYWPLVYDPEGEVYENVAWDLPGFRKTVSPKPRVSGKRHAHPGRPGNS